MRALMIPTTIGNTIGISAGRSIALIAEPVTMSIARPYSGRVVPSMIPGFSRNWRRTSVDDLAADAPDRLHRERREQERHQPADEEAGDHPRVAEAERRASRPSSASPVVYESKRTSAASAAEPIA